MTLAVLTNFNSVSRLHAAPVCTLEFAVKLCENNWQAVLIMKPSFLIKPSALCELLLPVLLFHA